MIAHPAIVVATYNRPHSLQRVLHSIAIANYQGYDNIPLVISIDGGGNSQCLQIAENFEWKHGEKHVICRETNMGLKAHILSCGDLTAQYGAIIMLEEDIYVSPYFYDYSVQTTSYYQDDVKIAGVSLFFLKNNELSGTPFEPLRNGYDAFFAQVPSSWGQTWTREQWKRFRQWFSGHDNKPLSNRLPAAVRDVWPDKSSWKKFFYSYMVENDLYFVLPYVAYATNMGDTGEHFAQQTMMFQTCLMEYPAELRLCPFSKEGVVYDAYFELLPESFHKLGVLQEYEVTIDLSGTKPLTDIETPYLLSIKPCSKPISSYDMCLSPVEVNVIENNTNGRIFLGKIQDFLPQRDEEALKQLMRINNEMVYQNGFYFGYKWGLQEENHRMKKTKYYKFGAVLLKPFKQVKQLFSKK